VVTVFSGQSEIGFGDGADEAADVVVATFEASAASARPRVSISDEELAAHEARLQRLRKKAGRAVWDAMVAAEPDAAVA